jgi:hypothetical protein
MAIMEEMKENEKTGMTYLDVHCNDIDQRGALV